MKNKLKNNSKNSITKIYYNLKEIAPIVHLKYRQLLVRVKEISKKYGDNRELIFKKLNEWNIHFSVIKEFTRKRKKIDYVLFTTISCKYKFSKGYWKVFIDDLNKALKKIDNKSRIKYVIEKNKNDTNHLHFMTSFSQVRTLQRIIDRHYIMQKENDMDTLIKYVTDVKNLNKYFNKQTKSILLK